MPSARARCIRIAAVLLAPAAGCAAPPVDMPDWTNPGTASYQQKRANRWDQYAETGIGGDMDGARPREFSESNPEPTRARWSFWPFSGQ